MAIDNKNTVPNAPSKGNVPALRFPEFTDEWIFAPLYDYLEENKERNRNDEFDKVDVLSVSGDYGIVNQIQLLGRSFAGSSVRDYHIVRKGNIVYTKSPLKEYPYGIVKVNKGNEGIVSTLYAVYNVKQNALGDFIESYFALPKRTNRYFKPIVRIGAKHDMKIGNEEAIANIVCFPSYAEQRKISAFISLLNERISIQSRIIEDLKKLKSAIYQEMFGSLVAQTLKLGQIVEIVKGKQVNGTELLEQGDYYVMNGGTTPSGWLNKYNTEANTISISEGGNSCGYVQYNTYRYWSGGHCYSLKILHPQEISVLYLYHFLKWQEENIMALRIGSGLPNIQKKDLLRFHVILPTITQQNKIVLILSAIEKKVSCEISITQYLVNAPIVDCLSSNE